ncbi:MAG: EamA family transporter [Clostridiales bacterium]|nr:EamA family transporter [Clostridiales bacterium]
MWFLFALIATLAWGGADLFYKKGTDENDSQSHLKIAVWVGLVMGVCALALLPFAESGIGVLNLHNLVRYAPASASYILSMVIGYAGLRYLEVSIVSPVQNASGAFSAVLMAIWFAFTADNFTEAFSEETGFVFGEVQGLSLVNNILIGAGFVVICAGVIALAVVEHRLAAGELTETKENRKYRLGALALLFPLLYCIFDTIGTAADGIILDGDHGLSLGEIDVMVIYGLTFFLFGLVCFVYMWVKNKKPYNPFKDKTKGVAACFEEFGQMFYVYAMAAKPVLAAPMIASYCIISVILSHIFLKEKLKKGQYVCVIAVILGIVMLGISEGIGNL